MHANVIACLKLKYNHSADARATAQGFLPSRGRGRNARYAQVRCQLGLRARYVRGVLVRCTLAQREDFRD